METTTIQIHKSTLQRLQQFRHYPRQSYDELLNAVFDDVDEEPLTAEEIEDIKRGLDDLKHGRLHKLEAVAKELGISLGR